MPSYLEKKNVQTIQEAEVLDTVEIPANRPGKFDTNCCLVTRAVTYSVTFLITSIQIRIFDN
jgi:hypothetical protein